MDPRHDKKRNKEILQRESCRKRKDEAIRRYGPLLERIESHRVGLLLMGGESGIDLAIFRRHVVAGYELPSRLERSLLEFLETPVSITVRLFDLLPDLLLTARIGLDHVDRTRLDSLLGRYERFGWTTGEEELAKAFYEMAIAGS